MFLPIHRVERVNKDESIGSVQSMSDLFEARVGESVWEHLGVKPGLPAGEPSSVVRADWMSLADAEVDYLERVLEDCGGDRAAAAAILGLTEDSLDEKLG